MAYSVYITRRKDWANHAGPSIGEDEWQERAQGNPELATLHWHAGNVEAKDPDRALVRRMVAVATSLGGRVQGDDGESYDGQGNAIPAPSPGVASRVVSWLRNRVSSGATGVAESSLPFRVGDRVRDSWGNAGTVTVIDVGAERGLGRVTVQLEDGRTLHMSAAAHGLEKIE